MTCESDSSDPVAYKWLQKWVGWNIWLAASALAFSRFTTYTKSFTLRWLKYTTSLKIKFVYEPSRPRRLKSFAFGFDKAEISAFRALTRHNFSEADQKVGGLEDTVAHPVLPIPTLMNIVIEIIRNEERLSQSLNLRMLKVKISSTCLFAL